MDCVGGSIEAADCAHTMMKQPCRVSRGKVSKESLRIMTRASDLLILLNVELITYHEIEKGYPTLEMTFCPLPSALITRRSP